MARHFGIQCKTNTAGNGYDIDVSDGGMVIADATRQNQAFLLVGNPGEFENKNTGVGIEDMLNDHETGEWQRRIMEQLEANGQFVDFLDINQNGAITLTAHYIN